MNKTIFIKISVSVFLLICIFFAYHDGLHRAAEEVTEAGIKRTLVTYAVSRSLNGVISVAQGTEVAVSPAGVGLTFAPGQILDPVNDLIERFSSIVLLSGTSLGIQRLLLEISSTNVINVALSVFVVIFLISLWGKFNRQENLVKIRSYLSRCVLLLLLVRFSVPCLAILNELLYEQYLQPEYNEAQLHLEQASENIHFINQSVEKQSVQENANWLEQAENWLNSTKNNIDINAQITALQQAASDISRQVINLIVVFVLQTILFPLLFLWLIVQLGKFFVRQFHWPTA